MTEETQPVGQFAVVLKRNNKQIRDDRAQTIIEQAKLRARRQIEDMQMDLSQFKRDREAMLDLSPTTTIGLTLISDFKAEEFMNKDLEIGVNIYNLEIKLKIAIDRYKYLFGADPVTAVV